MPIDPSIPLQSRPPDIMTPGQAVSLQALVQNMQMGRMQMAQQLKEQQTLEAIREIYRRPNAIDQTTGQPTPLTLADLSKIDPIYSQKAAASAEQAAFRLSEIKNIQDQQQTRDDARRKEAEVKVKEMAEVGVSVAMLAENAGAHPSVVNEKFVGAWHDEVERRHKSGALNEKEYQAAMGAPFDYERAKAIVKPPKELEAERQKAKAEERAEETPFMKELKSRGVKPGSEEWNREIKKHQQKQEGLTINLGPSISEKGLESAAAQAATGQPLNQVVPGYGNAAAAKREQVRQGAIAQIIKERPGITQAEAGLELANRSTDYVAGRRSVTQLNLMLGATKQAVSQLEFNVNKTKEVLRKIPSSDLSPIINAIVRQEEKWTGDPKYSELFYFMSATAQESARILQGGQASVAQLHQGAADEARKWANVNMTPKMFVEGVAPAMIQEGRFRIKSYEDAMKSQRSGAPPGQMPITETTPMSNLRKPEAPARVRTIEEAKQLKPGTHFIDPNGVERVR